MPLKEQTKKQPSKKTSDINKAENTKGWKLKKKQRGIIIWENELKPEITLELSHTEEGWELYLWRGNFNSYLFHSDTRKACLSYAIKYMIEKKDVTVSD